MYFPKITIITITYNSEKTVRETFDSIRLQHYDNLEYIVVDGGSTDSTLKIAEEYNDLITTLVSEADEGISDAMNKGIRLASGELIGIIHSDDLLEKGALVCLANEWDGESDIYYGHSLMINENSEPQNILCAQKNLNGMKYGFCMVHASTFVTKEAYRKYGLFDMNYKCAMDYELLLRFYKAGAKFKYIDAVLARYRIGGTNMKMRRRTINEVRDVSVFHGGSRVIAEVIKMKKMLIDSIRPLLKKHGIHSKRVIMNEDITDA